MPRRSDAVITPNEVLTAARKRFRSPHRPGQHISRAELADVVNRTLDRLYPKRDRAALYVDARWVGKLERGESRWPVCERRRALRDVFGIATDIELGLYSPRRTEELAGSGLEPGLAGRAGVNLRDKIISADEYSVSLLGQRASMHRNDAISVRARPPSAQSYVPVLPAALDRAAQDWLHGTIQLRTVVAPSTQQVRHPPAVADAARLLQTLRDMDHQQGAGVAGDLVSSFINGQVRALILAPYADRRLRVAGYRVAVAARELAGYQAVDLGADGVAQRHYLHALSLSSAINDRSLGAYLLGVSLAHLALHCGYPQQGLRLAQTALAGAAAGTTPAVLASIWAVVARSYARLGDESACTMALRSAEMHLANSDAGTEPEWIRYLTSAYLADEVAHCMFDLCRHESAQREIRQAVIGVGHSRVRRLVIDTALLASSLAATGRIDEACVRGREAVNLATRTASARAVQRVAQVRADLIPFEDVQAVRDLIDYIHEVLPAAA
ncbi:XRE family transcriptional regulator [Actinoplanes sp. NPDC049316]|uniref:XRE family transcriptional regulator n=1 Tax=Actinoplanes sp. NPDC049316 TaxID=3154727 RepID=UPI0034492663